MLSCAVTRLKDSENRIFVVVMFVVGCLGHTMRVALGFNILG